MENHQIVSVDKLPPPPTINLIGNPRASEHPQCAKCGLIFKKELDLKKHLNSDLWNKYVEIKFKGHRNCDECCVFFKTTKAYMQHLGKFHTSDSKNSLCVICGKSFKSKYAVKFHVRQVHDKVTRTNCPKCGKQFYSKYLIPDHLERCRG